MTDISVIICTWNNSHRLAITLESICRCRIPGNVAWELILVANNCTDETRKVAKGMSDRFPLVYVEEPIQGLSRAKNTGIHHAFGSLLVFTDDDVHPAPWWIETYWSAFLQQPRGFFWGGPVESEFEGPKPDPELLAAAPYSVKGLEYGPIKRELDKGECFLSANWACPRDAIVQAGGFDTRLGLNARMGEVSTGEESDLMTRLFEAGQRGRYLPEARLRHFVPKDKCTYDHILTRCVAGARLSARFLDYRLKWLDFGPFKPGLSLHIFKRWLTLWGAKMIGRRAFKENIDLKIWMEIYKVLSKGGA
jgi:glucosyl-dolichyl phosphate glucuronosyltransferase